jgi:phage gp29-like protein
MDIPAQDAAEMAAQQTAAEQAKPVMEEVAISSDGRDITLAFMGALREVQDTVLRRLGNNYEVYRELRRDDQVHTCFQQRRLNLTARPLVIAPGGDRPIDVAAADFLRDNLAQIPFDRSSGMALWGLLYGYSVGECMLEIRERKVWLGKIKIRTPWRFRFDQAGGLRLLTRTNMITGELMPPRKFWVTSWGADNDDDPYGLGLAHQLYWPVFFKKQGLSFWLRALEKFGAPSTVAKYPAGSDKSVRDQALAVARQLRLDGAAAIPDTMVVSLLEAARGTVDQTTFHRQMNAAIAKIIVGQTMTTDDGSSLAQSEVHERMLEALTDSDAELLCEGFQNGPAAWLTGWNFPGAKTPVCSRPSPEDEAAAAELLEKRGKAVKAARDAGLEPVDDSIIPAFIPGWRLAPAPQTPALGAPVQRLALPAPAFAETGRDADLIDDFARDLDWEPIMTPIVERIAAFVESRPDLQTAANELGELLGDPANGQLVEVLGRALFEAKAAGAAGVAISEHQAAADRAVP